MEERVDRGQYGRRRGNGTGGVALKIFISHGSGKDAEVASALELIAPQLSDRGYDVFVDVDELRVGQRWHPVLYEEMYLCDAAIVLLGPNTITDSDWVRRESDVLMSRHIVRSLRTVLPCFIGTQDTKKARQRGFGTLLNLQAELGRRDKNPLPLGGLAERVTEWILKEFAPVAGPPGERTFHAWTKRISSFLRSARERDPSSIVDAADALSCSRDEKLHVRASVGAELFLAHLLFQAGECVRGEGQSALPAAIAALRSGLGSGQLGYLVAELMPTWADPDEAARFAPVHPPQDGDRGPLVLLGAHGDWAAEQHIRRALHNAPAAFSHRVLTAQAALPADESDPYDELLKSCLSALREVFALPPEMTLEPEAVRPREQTRDYLVINTKGYGLQDVARVVNKLHADFSWLVIVVLSPEGVPENKVLDDLGISRAASVVLSQELQMRAYSFRQSLCDVVDIAG
ncbi:toll/interleukin-1 receptor domain-containing protein [Streptomyces sp. NPDC002835]